LPSEDTTPPVTKIRGVMVLLPLESRSLPTRPVQGEPYARRDDAGIGAKHRGARPAGN
jgi:hypothetical protein